MTQDLAKHKNWPEKLKEMTIGVKIAVVVSFIFLWGIFFWHLVPEQTSWEVGGVAEQDVHADRSVTYEDKEATRLKEKEALKGFQDVYTLSLVRFNQISLATVDNDFDELNRIIVQKKGKARNSSEAPDLTLAEQKKALQETLSLTLSADELNALLEYDDTKLENLHKNVVAVMSEIMGAGVRENQVGAARNQILESISGDASLSDLDKKVLDQLLNGVTLYPTQVYDQKATQAKKDEIIKQVDPVWHTIQKGQLIVNRGEVITAAHYEAMTALGYTTDRSPVGIGIGIGLMLLILYVSLIRYLLRYYEKAAFIKRLKLCLLILLINVLLFTLFSAIRVGDSEMALRQVYLLAPVTAGVLLAAVLMSSREALAILTATTFLYVFYGQDILAAVASLLAGLVAVSQVRHLQRRLDLGRVAVAVGASLAAVTVAQGIFWEQNLTVIALGLGFSFANGIAAVIITLGILPYIEKAFDMTTSVSLLELGDQSNTLLKRLMLEAPGTYHHSMMVANLAEAAADAIGADPLLTRIGAYYHDIGKLRRPIFFAENQFTQKNPHEKISPMLSTLIITSHVKDGVAMAQEAGLPESVIDLIGQHHGNTVVRYFYSEAQKLDPEVQEKDFRYPQKKPQSREAAVLMLADSVEAAVRSAGGKLTAGQIEGVVHKIIQQKLADGQFSECPVTFRDLHETGEVFSRMLCGIYHKRIEYPDSKELKEGGNA